MTFQLSVPGIPPKIRMVSHFIREFKLKGRRDVKNGPVAGSGK